MCARPIGWLVTGCLLTWLGAWRGGSRVHGRTRQDGKIQTHYRQGVCSLLDKSSMLVSGNEASEIEAAESEGVYPGSYIVLDSVCPSCQTLLDNLHIGCVCRGSAR